MKLLWFANTPCGSWKHLNVDSIFGGWLVSLENELKLVENIELNVSFLFPQRIKPFRYESVNYFPIYKPDLKNNLSSLFKYATIKKYNNSYFEQKSLEVVQLVKPDLIHIHGTENPFGSILGNIKEPVLLTLQGILTICKEKYHSEIPDIIIRRYASLIRRILKISYINQYKNFIEWSNNEKEVLSKVDYVTGRTNFDRKVLNIISEKKLNYFHLDEILRNEFYLAEWNKTKYSKPLRLISVISSLPYKGFHTIYNTACLMKNKIDFVWDIIGIKQNSEIISILKKWKNINLKDNKLNILGILDSNKLSKRLIESDIFIQTSRIENSSNSLCEAMLVGIPIIASNVGGTSSLIIDREDGVLFQEGESYILAGEILTLSNEIETARKYGSSARSKAIKRHDHRFILSELIYIYNNLLNDVNK